MSNMTWNMTWNLEKTHDMGVKCCIWDGCQIWKGHLTFSAKDKTLFWFAASLYICDPNFDIKANNILVKQRICSSKKAEYHPLSRCWVVLSFRSGLVTECVLSSDQFLFCWQNSFFPSKIWNVQLSVLGQRLMQVWVTGFRHQKF